MANLTTTKTYTPSLGSVLNSTGYNTDLSALFNNFINMEAQTIFSKGLTITPSVNGTTKFKITNTATTELLSTDTTNSYLKLAYAANLRFSVGDTFTTYIVSKNANVISAGAGTDKLLIGAYVYSSMAFYFGSTSSNTYIDDTSGLTLNFFINPTTGSDFNIVFSTLTILYKGIRIGTNSTNNMIDDASNGSSTTPLFIGNQNIVTSTGTTGGTGSAGAGNQYVEFKIGTTVFKFLHDGTV